MYSMMRATWNQVNLMSKGVFHLRRVGGWRANRQVDFMRQRAVDAFLLSLRNRDSAFHQMPLGIRRRMLLADGFPWRGVASTPKAFGYALGKDIISNGDVLRICLLNSNDPSGAGFLAAAGIGWRHWRGDENIVSLHGRAFAKMIALNPDVRQEMLDVVSRGKQVAIIVGGQAGPRQPSMAHIMHGHLAQQFDLPLPHHLVRGFTVDSVCTSGVMAFSTATSLIASGDVEGVLVFVNGDYEGSGVLDKTPMGKTNGNAFFGTAVACTWISPAHFAGHRIFRPVTYSDGSNADVIQIVPPPIDQVLKIPKNGREGHFAMDSPRVQTAVKINLLPLLRRWMQTNGLAEDEMSIYKFMFPHTGNISMLSDAFDPFEYPMDRVSWGGTRHGNVDAASFLKDMAVAYESGHITVGDLLGLVAYGGGFQMGALGFVSEAPRPAKPVISDNGAFLSVSHFWKNRDRYAAELELEHLKANPT